MKILLLTALALKNESGNATKLNFNEPEEHELLLQDANRQIESPESLAQFESMLHNKYKSLEDFITTASDDEIDSAAMVAAKRVGPNDNEDKQTFQSLLQQHDRHNYFKHYSSFSQNIAFTEPKGQSEDEDVNGLAQEADAAPDKPAAPVAAPAKPAAPAAVADKPVAEKKADTPPAKENAKKADDTAKPAADGTKPADDAAKPAAPKMSADDFDEHGECIHFPNDSEFDCKEHKAKRAKLHKVKQIQKKERDEKLDAKMMGKKDETDSKKKTGKKARHNKKGSIQADEFDYATATGGDKKEKKDAKKEDGKKADAAKKPAPADAAAKPAADADAAAKPAANANKKEQPAKKADDAAKPAAKAPEAKKSIVQKKLKRDPLFHMRDNPDAQEAFGDAVWPGHTPGVEHLPPTKHYPGLADKKKHHKHNVETKTETAGDDEDSESENADDDGSAFEKLDEHMEEKEEVPSEQKEYIKAQLMSTKEKVKKHKLAMKIAQQQFEKYKKEKKQQSLLQRHSVQHKSSKKQTFKKHKKHAKSHSKIKMNKMPNLKSLHKKNGKHQKAKAAKHGHKKHSN